LNQVSSGFHNFANRGFMRLGRFLAAVMFHHELARGSMKNLPF